MGTSRRAQEINEAIKDARKLLPPSRDEIWRQVQAEARDETSHNPRTVAQETRANASLASLRVTCPICSSFIDEGAYLANGSLVHRACLVNLQASVQTADDNVNRDREALASLKRERDSQATFFGQFKAAIRGSKKDPQELDKLVNDVQRNLKELEETAVSRKATATAIYDLLLDYPPDWRERTKAVHDRDDVCTSCGRSRDLQVHHVTPLGRGGTNRIENLTLLCERCHRREHNVRSFSGRGITSGAGTAFAERIQVISRAIKAGADVEFLYRKPTEESFHKRVVTPFQLTEVNHEHDSETTLCLKGFCHLRHDDRHFALKRMRSLRIH